MPFTCMAMWAKQVSAARMLLPGCAKLATHALAPVDRKPAAHYAIRLHTKTLFQKLQSVFRAVRGGAQQTDSSQRLACLRSTRVPFGRWQCRCCGSQRHHCEASAAPSSHTALRVRGRTDHPQTQVICFACRQLHAQLGRLAAVGMLLAVGKLSEVGKHPSFAFVCSPMSAQLRKLPAVGNRGLRVTARRDLARVRHLHTYARERDPAVSSTGMLKPKPGVLPKWAFLSSTKLDPRLSPACLRSRMLTMWCGRKKETSNTSRGKEGLCRGTSVGC
eukprot:354463-Chlamydomonas_euryale.AAC.2